MTQMRGILIILFLGLILTSVSCSPVSTASDSPPSSTECPGIFRSSQIYSIVQVPAGWGAADGPETLAKPFEGQAAFNSWGEKDFWAREIRNYASLTYSVWTVKQQVPDDGAYMAIVQIYPPGGEVSDPPAEYTLNDLSGLCQPHDWREEAASGAHFIDFYKWRRFLRLEICCNAGASDATVDALNDLLQSWKFDEIPAGDPGWAFSAACQLLPAQVGPEKFSSWTSGRHDQTVVRNSQVEVLPDRTVHFRFTYFWNLPATPSPGTTDHPSETFHWWEIDVLPDGKAVLLAESGESLLFAGD